jgi:MFS family permease
VTGVLSRPVAFAAVTAITMTFMAASSAPSPLYVVYQQDWGFSPATLTVVFAVYVLGLLGSVLVVGALSDHVGRRPVLAAAIALEAASLVLFLVAGGVPVLLVARLAQGIATGAAITTLGAALVDLHPGRAGTTTGVATLGGLAVGAIGCGALVEFAPAPTQLVYALLLAAMAAGALVVWRMPETAARRPGARASLRPRIGLPARLRPEFLAVLPTLVASWALGGLYLSLGPSVAAGIFGLRDHLVGGLVVALLCGTGAVTAFALRNVTVPRVLATASALLATGTLTTLIGMRAGSVAPAALGTVVAGIGFGAAALGCFGTFARIAAPAERGELFAVAYLFSYLSFSIPAVAAGVATGLVGLRPTAEVYGVVVVALGVAALVAQRMITARRVVPSSGAAASPGRSGSTRSARRRTGRAA